MTVLTVPRLEDILAGRLAVSQIRVELEDLLGRGRVKLDDAGLHGLMTNRVILVTGEGDLLDPNFAVKSLDLPLQNCCCWM